jgi:hypothetical protein
MNQRSGFKFSVLAASVAALLAVSGGAFLLWPKAETPPSSDNAVESFVESDAMALTTVISTDAVMDPMPSPQAQPIIEGDLRPQAETISRLWANGPNLAEHYVQMVIPCGAPCRQLVIGNMTTGELVQTGMGFDDMDDLDSDSLRTADLLLLMWVNIGQGNCARAIYRWDGQQLMGVSDVVTYGYTDAGCGQYNLPSVMSDLS